MIMVPNFRHFRLLSTVSLAGTAYTAIYITVTTGKLFACNANSMTLDFPKNNLLPLSNQEGLSCCDVGF